MYKAQTCNGVEWEATDRSWNLELDFRNDSYDLVINPRDYDSNSIVLTPESARELKEALDDERC